jgi:hypothetical protein
MLKATLVILACGVWNNGMGKNQVTINFKKTL